MTVSIYILRLSACWFSRDICRLVANVLVVIFTDKNAMKKWLHYQPSRYGARIYVSRDKCIHTGTFNTRIICPLQFVLSTVQVICRHTSNVYTK